MRHTLLLASALALVSTLYVPVAEASVSDDLNWIIGGIAVGVPYVTVSAVLIGEGLDDGAARGHGLAEVGAILEILWASLHLAAGTGMLIAASVAGAAGGCQGGCTQLAALAGVGGTLMLVGAAYLSHGVWSLTGGRPPPLRVALAPTDGGAYGSFDVAF